MHVLVAIDAQEEGAQGHRDEGQQTPDGDKLVEEQPGEDRGEPGREGGSDDFQLVAADLTTV